MYQCLLLCLTDIVDEALHREVARIVNHIGNLADQGPAGKRLQGAFLCFIKV